MSDFLGRLSIIGHQSTLHDDYDHLLLKAGIPDPAQATFAATQFLVQTRGLHSGQIILVTGEQATIGAVSAISMSDAGPAAQDNEMLVSSAVRALVPPGRSRRKAKMSKPA